MSEHDPAREEDVGAELRDAWRQLSPPPLPDASEAADPTTAATVRWMQSAWRALEAPPGSARLQPGSSVLSTLGKRPGWSPALPGRRLRPRLVALAALVLATLGVLWRVLAPPRATEPEVTPLARVPAVEVLEVRPEQLELRSGPVRLVLVTPAAAQNTLPNEGS